MNPKVEGLSLKIIIKRCTPTLDLPEKINLLASLKQKYIFSSRPSAGEFTITAVLAITQG